MIKHVKKTAALPDEKRGLHPNLHQVYRIFKTLKTPVKSEEDRSERRYNVQKKYRDQQAASMVQKIRLATLKIRYSAQVVITVTTFMFLLFFFTELTI